VPSPRPAPVPIAPSSFEASAGPSAGPEEPAPPAPPPRALCHGCHGKKGDSYGNPCGVCRGSGLEPPVRAFGELQDEPLDLDRAMGRVPPPPWSNQAITLDELKAYLRRMAEDIRGYMTDAREHIDDLWGALEDATSTEDGMFTAESNRAGGREAAFNALQALRAVGRELELVSGYIRKLPSGGKGVARG